MSQFVSSMPAPWHLHGEGFVLVYHFPRSFILPLIERQSSIPSSELGRFLGGFSFVMLMNYARSEVGPYQELLFIPGRFQLGAASGYTVTNILVSSLASAVNGRSNWGLPKEVAQFEWQSSGHYQRTIQVARQHETFLSVRFRASKFHFPLPFGLFPFSLVQAFNQQVYVTRLSGWGTAHFAHLNLLSTQSHFFPSVFHHSPLAVFMLSRFDVTFQSPQVG